MDQKGTAENPGIAIQLSGGALTPSLGPPGDAAVPTDEPSKGPITPRALISNTMTYKTKRYVSSIEARAVLDLACTRRSTRTAQVMYRSERHPFAIEVNFLPWK